MIYIYSFLVFFMSALQVKMSHASDSISPGFEGRADVQPQMERLIQARGGVEQKAKDIDAQWKHLQSELDVYVQRKQELTVQITREELRRKQIVGKTDSIVKRFKKSRKNLAAERMNLGKLADQLASHISSGLPYDVDGRLGRVAEITELLKRETTDTVFAAQELWNIYVKELRLTRSTDYSIMPLKFGSEAESVRIVRLGMMQMFYQREGGEVGFAVRNGDSYKLAAASGDEIASVRVLFEKFENNHRMGWFELPLRSLGPNGVAVSRYPRYPSKLAFLFFEKAFADGGTRSWVDALAREHAFVASQMESLRKQEESVRKSRELQLKAAKDQIGDLESRLVDLQLGNEEKDLELKRITQDQQAASTREDSLGRLWGKMKRSTLEARNDWSLASEREISLPPAPENLELSSLSELWEESFVLLKKLSTVETLKADVKDQNGVLHRQPVVRWGGLASFADMGRGGYSLLGPSGDGDLVPLEESVLLDIQNGVIGGVLRGGKSLVPMFLYDGLNHRVAIKKSAKWADKVADQIPLLFLGLMFSIVFFIFFRLARA